MIYMDKIRCSADVRSKMSRWARGLCHHESGLQDQLRPVCPIVRASTSLPERDLSQGWGWAWLPVTSSQQPWRHVLVGRREDSGSDVQEGQCWGLRRFVGPSPRHWEDCVHGEGWELSSCFKTWIKPASEFRVL